MMQKKDSGSPTHSIKFLPTSHKLCANLFDPADDPSWHKMRLKWKEEVLFYYIKVLSWKGLLDFV